jgi:hypothetical protein
MINVELAKVLGYIYSVSRRHTKNHGVFAIVPL